MLLFLLSIICRINRLSITKISKDFQKVGAAWIFVCYDSNVRRRIGHTRDSFCHRYCCLTESYSKYIPCYGAATNKYNVVANYCFWVVDFVAMLQLVDESNLMVLLLFEFMYYD